MRSRRAAWEAGIAPAAASLIASRPPSVRRARRPLGGHLGGPRVVSLAARRATNLRHDDDRARCLVARDMSAGVRDQLGLGRRVDVRSELHDGRDALPEALVRYA